MRFSASRGVLFAALLLITVVVCEVACKPQAAATQNVPVSKAEPVSTLASIPAVTMSSKQIEAWQKHLALLKKQDAELVAGLQGQLVKEQIDSAILGRKIDVWLYLPPDYEKSPAMRCPAAYILHGAPGGLRDCFVDAKVHRVAEELILKKQIAPLILVGFDGAGPKGLEDLTYFLNRADGSYSLEDFTVRELVPWVDAHFRTRADASSRGLIGFSAGGYGAANLGLKHPDIWRVIASHAGFFDPQDDAKIMTDILGPRGPLWQENSPLIRVRDLPQGQRLHFYMDVGRDDTLLGEFKKMKSELKMRGVDFEAHVFEGAHEWDFLNHHYFDSLRFCDANWKEMANRR